MPTKQEMRSTAGKKSAQGLHSSENKWLMFFSGPCSQAKIKRQLPLSQMWI